MSERLLRLLAVAIVIGGTIWGGYWFRHHFERATRTVRSGYSEAALRNPFLAAERLVDKIGDHATSVTGTSLWRSLPPADGVLVVYRFWEVSDIRRQQALRHWIEAGGRLIVAADDSLLARHGTRPKGFLAQLGVRLKLAGDDAKQKRPDTAAIKFSEYPQRPLQIHFSPYRYLEDSSGKATAAAPWGNGYCLLQYRLGDGLVTVLSDNDFLTNRQIGKHDHALALALLTGLPRHAQVWFVHDVEMPSLPALIWQHAAMAVIAAAVALLLWLWHMSGRLGPLLPPQQRPRRDLGEHLEASANFLWRLDNAQQLFRANQLRLEQSWLNKHYLLRAMTREQRCAWIAARAGLSRRAVERALHGEYLVERDFVELSSYLQILDMTL